MEFTKNDTSGLWIVTLGGTRWTNCTTNDDCPGNAQCAKNEPWAQDVRFCGCIMSRIVDGPTCKTLTDFGRLDIGLTLTICILTVSMALAGIHALFLAWLHVKESRISAVSVSLAFAIMACICLAVQCGSIAASTLRQEGFDVRRTGAEALGRTLDITMPLVLFLVSLTGMNVSLVWITIADNARKMRSVGSANIVAYRRTLIVYYVALLSALAAAIITGRFAVVAIIAAVGVVILFATNALALYKINQLIQTLSGSTSSGNAIEEVPSRPATNPTNSKEEEVSEEQVSDPKDNAKPRAARSVRKDKTSAPPRAISDALSSIRTVIIRLIVTSGTLVLSLIVYSTTGAPQYTPTSNLPLARGAYAVLWLSVTFLVASVLVYLRALTLEKVTVHKSKGKANHLTVVVASNHGPALGSMPSVSGPSKS